MPAPGDLLADRYRLGTLLGVGGMATVHRAHDERLDRDVAIKVLLPNLAADPLLPRRFEREARAMAAVADPSLVAVFDVDPGDPVAGREPFVVMELCPGGSLADRLGPGRPMSPDELVPILVAVSGGLAALHRAGLVHRDVKPSNILFAADRVKLGDFGLARSDTEVSELTQPGTAMGTLGYLAPERLRGAAGDAASDVYALGTVGYLGLTGRMPRAVGSVRDVVESADLRPPPVSGAAPALGTAFDQPLADALATDPTRRPDALDFGSSLAAALGRWTRSGRPGAGGTPPSTPAASVPSGTATADDMTTALAVTVGATARIDVAPPDVGPVDMDVPDGAAPRAGLRGRPPTPPRVAGRPPSSGRGAPRRSSAASRVALLVVGVLILAGLALYLRACQSIPSLPGGIPAASSSAPSASSRAPSPSPSVLASPSIVPSASPTVPAPSADPAIAALDDVDAAIAAARGGPQGLKGKDANALESLAARVRRDLDAGDRRRALSDARELDRRARDVAHYLEDQVASRLTKATGHLVDVLGG